MIDTAKIKKLDYNFVIKEANDEDSGAIIELIFNIWIKEYGFQLNKDDFPDLKHINEHYKHGCFLKALLGDEIVGTIAFDKLGERSFVLKRMFVAKPHRGCGISQQLLDVLMKKIQLNVPSNNFSIYLSTKEAEAVAAKKLYLKNNFQVISKDLLPKGFPLFYQDDLFMVLKVS